jgi:hypothetical protein
VIRLWNEVSADPCNENSGSSLQVRLTAPKRVDSWQMSSDDPFNSSLSIFFADREFKPAPLDNMKADEGGITIVELSKTQVTGYFNGSFRRPKVGRTDVKGGFTVPVCETRSALPDDSFGDNFSL